MCVSARDKRCRAAPDDTHGQAALDELSESACGASWIEESDVPTASEWSVFLVLTLSSLSIAFSSQPQHSSCISRSVLPARSTAQRRTAGPSFAARRDDGPSARIVILKSSSLGVCLLSCISFTIIPSALSTTCILGVSR